jgi:hypothetical protein
MLVTNTDYEKQWARLTLRSLCLKQVDGIVAACSLLPESPDMSRGDWSTALYSEMRRWGRHVAPPNGAVYGIRRVQGIGRRCTQVISSIRIYPCCITRFGAE